MSKIKLGRIPGDFNRSCGAIVGCALGDAYCAPFEGGFLERMLWRLLGRDRLGKKRWTDDTQMTLNVLSILLEHSTIDQDALAILFSKHYRWSRGYGPGAAKVLRKIRRGIHWSVANRAVFKDGSWGNGAAMRVAPICVYCQDDVQRMLQLVEESAVITHAHPLAISGAQIIATAIVHGLRNDMGWNFMNALNELSVQDEFKYKIDAALTLEVEATPRDVVRASGNGISALESCVTAVYCAQRYIDRSVLDLLEFIRDMGGDTDTVASMAASIWGAARGVQDFDVELLEEVEKSEEILGLSLELCKNRKLKK